MGKNCFLETFQNAFAHYEFYFNKSRKPNLEGKKTNNYAGFGVYFSHLLNTGIGK